MAGTGVGKFSSTASNNTSNLTVNFAENMAPSNVNNAARELMGHMRDMYEQLGDGYFEFGDGDGEYTVTRGDADTITITGTGDITSVYYVGRKIRITDGGANVVEGVISGSSHSSTTQTIDLSGISLASGTPTKVELGIDTAAFGGKVILDDDGDTYIEAPTDDTIDIYVAGAKDFVITANTFTAESGSTIAAQALTAAGLITANANITMAGTTPTLTVGDGGAEDAKILFDGNAQNFHIGLDDSTEKLTIGLGNALGTYPGFTMDENTNVEFPDNSVTIISSGNNDNLTLTSTDADANSGPNLRLYRNSSSPADADTIGVVEFEGRNDNSQDVIYSQMRTVVNDVSDGTEDGQIDIKIMNGGSLNMIASFKGPETVINDASIDHDFRVESNGNANMFLVNGGSNLVGIGDNPDLGTGLHIKTADSGASAHATGDELVIEGSGNAGLSILSGNTHEGVVYFGDDGDNNIGRIVYDHNVNDMVFYVAATEMLRIDSDNNNLATGGETAGDVGAFGLCLNQGSADGQILTLKSSDIAHGITDFAETDTYFTLAKNEINNGGTRIESLTENDIAFEFIGIETSGDTTKATNGSCCFDFGAHLKDGTGTANPSATNANHNLFGVRDRYNTRFIIDSEGDLHRDNTGDSAYDTYDDAQLMRTLDLTRGEQLKGFINSKFDEHIKYNHEDLAQAGLVGREKDGTPNNFINITGFQRLHHGAIWQQYEKTERLANAVYELAKAAVGEEKANEILEQNEIKLLN